MARWVPAQTYQTCLLEPRITELSFLAKTRRDYIGSRERLLQQLGDCEGTRGGHSYAWRVATGMGEGRGPFLLRKAERPCGEKHVTAEKWGLQAQLGGEPQAAAMERAVANKSGSMPIEVCTWSRCKGMLEDRVYSVCRRGCG